jgi:hypothetical protein
MTAAANHDWGSADLFPQYGMPSFPAPIQIKPIGTIPALPKKIPPLSPTLLVRPAHLMPELRTTSTTHVDATPKRPLTTRS